MITRLILLAIVVSVSAVDAQNYAVHLMAPQHAGQSYAVSTTGSRSDQTSIGDRVLQAAEYQVSFEGAAEILKVDSRQRPIRIDFTVRKFMKIEGGATVDLVTPGSVIVADGSRQEPISLRDGTMQQPVREAFRLVHSTHKPEDVTDDDIFGTKELKGIGDSWPMNSALAAENFKDTGMTIPAERLSGTVALVAREKIAATDCLSFQAKLGADGFTLASKDLPPEVTIDGGSKQAAFRGCFPMNDSGLSYREGTDLTLHMRLTSNQGVKLDVSSVQKQDAVWIELGR